LPGAYALFSGDCLKTGSAVFVPVAVALGFRNEELIALLIMLGSPTTPSSYVMAKNMGHEGVLTSSCIATTTLLSALTLTGWIFLAAQRGVFVTQICGRL